MVVTQTESCGQQRCQAASPDLLSASLMRNDDLIVPLISSPITFSIPPSLFDILLGPSNQAPCKPFCSSQHSPSLVVGSKDLALFLTKTNLRGCLQLFVLQCVPSIRQKPPSSRMFLVLVIPLFHQSTSCSWTCSLQDSSWYFLLSPPVVPSVLCEPL